MTWLVTTSIADLVIVTAGDLVIARDLVTAVDRVTTTRNLVIVGGLLTNGLDSD